MKRCGIWLTLFLAYCSGPNKSEEQAVNTGSAKTSTKIQTQLAAVDEEFSSDEHKLKEVAFICDGETHNIELENTGDYFIYHDVSECEIQVVKMFISHGSSGSDYIFNGDFENGSQVLVQEGSDDSTKKILIKLTATAEEACDGDCHLKNLDLVINLSAPATVKDKVDVKPDVKATKLSVKTVGETKDTDCDHKKDCHDSDDEDDYLPHPDPTQSPSQSE